MILNNVKNIFINTTINKRVLFQSFSIYGKYKLTSTNEKKRETKKY
ncbi:hypothetical protein PI23P_01210 [Polaribacter irgensii 23-P]|uniref:Uncharacterized protein n=1 Tax=Polaribacter irgensii 23-P TaxID=313594 RepID=A4C2H9_9FLAO|nr:hypothetical protein PI23P_01210 [Polaribacter irgensii 23-P]